MIEERKEIKRKLCLKYSYTTRKKKKWKEEYTALNKEVKRNLRKDYREYVDGIAREVQQTAKQGNIKDIYISIKRLTSNTLSATTLVKNKKEKQLHLQRNKLRDGKSTLRKHLMHPYPP